jgi:hypothetical protein
VVGAGARRSKWLAASSHSLAVGPQRRREPSRRTAPGVPSYGGGLGLEVAARREAWWGRPPANRYFRCTHAFLNRHARACPDGLRGAGRSRVASDSARYVLDVDEDEVVAPEV